MPDLVSLIHGIFHTGIRVYYLEIEAEDVPRNWALLHPNDDALQSSEAELGELIQIVIVILTH